MPRGRLWPGSHLPDPVASSGVHARVLLRISPGQHTTVIGLIPANGIENITTIGMGAVPERLSVNNVSRDGLDKSWRERGERVGELAKAQAVTFQRASDTGSIHVGLHPCRFQDRLLQVRHQDSDENGVGSRAGLESVFSFGTDLGEDTVRSLVNCREC